jgi:hypothetical protein
MNKSKYVSFRCPVQIVEEAEKLAKADQRTLSNWMRMNLVRWVKSKREPENNRDAISPA